MPRHCTTTHHSHRSERRADLLGFKEARGGALIALRPQLRRGNRNDAKQDRSHEQASTIHRKFP
jgi:hypothetical protein